MRASLRFRMLSQVALIVVGLALAACGGGAVGTPSAPASAVPASESPGDTSAGGSPQILPLFISSEITKGQTRLVFTLTDRANQLVAAPDVPVHLELYDVAAAPDTVAFEADARFLWAIEGQKGLYVADLSFPAAGRWGVRFTARFPDGTSTQVRADFDVAETGSTPAIGAPVVPLDTPTITGANADLATVTTDAKPDARFYETSVAEALVAGKPFVVVFATPAFCQTAICGPTLDMVKEVARDYPNLTFINVEPYKMVVTNGRLQPELDASGQLQAASWTDAWGLRSEPWVFVVGADGTMAAKFEGTLGADELRAAPRRAAAGARLIAGCVTVAPHGDRDGNRDRGRPGIGDHGPLVQPPHECGTGDRVLGRHARPRRRGLPGQPPARTHGDRRAGQRRVSDRGGRSGRDPTDGRTVGLSRAREPAAQVSSRPEHERGSGAGDGDQTRDLQLGRPGRRCVTASCPGARAKRVQLSCRHKAEGRCLRRGGLTGPIR